MWRALPALLLLLGACTQLMQGPSLAGYPGLQFQLESYYDNRALEENAVCTSPRMHISGYKVVEDTPARIVLDVRYQYIDDSHRDSRIDQFGMAVGGGGGQCIDWANRTFVVAKSEGGPPGTRRLSRWCR